jgi:hypothetical protein
MQNFDEKEWNGYVNSFLLPRLCGREIMTAPYVTAHLRLQMLLAKTGYKFENNSELRICLGDSLGDSSCS